jgi:hypothetical protein
MRVGPAAVLAGVAEVFGTADLHRLRGDPVVSVGRCAVSSIDVVHWRTPLSRSINSWVVDPPAQCAYQCRRFLMQPSLIKNKLSGDKYGID